MTSCPGSHDRVSHTFVVVSVSVGVVTFPVDLFILLITQVNAAEKKKKNHREVCVCVVLPSGGQGHSSFRVHRLLKRRDETH